VLADIQVGGMSGLDMQRVLSAKTEDGPGLLDAIRQVTQS